MGMNFFRNMLNSIVTRGRTLKISTFRQSDAWTGTVNEMLSRLLSVRGEVSGVTIASEIIKNYRTFSKERRTAFFRRLATEFGPDHAELERAWVVYEQTRTSDSFLNLARAVEAPRQELFRRLNRAPGGTAALLAMRWDVMGMVEGKPELAGVDNDLAHLLNSWFNPGFLVLQRISWSSPADILERIIRYEAVHTIQGWEDLRRRVQPQDRRCYAFFHPSLVDEPLIFVEVALTNGVPRSIQDLLTDDRQELPLNTATTATFYSISNCQPGLRGVSLGNFLIKQVVQELKNDLPHLKTFITLSPSPGFGVWLREIHEPQRNIGPDDLQILTSLQASGWHHDEAFISRARPVILKLACDYYLNAKTKSGAPLDPVARFHLGNGARLEQLNWIGDTSPKGLIEGAGLMVNYLYDLDTIEANHEAYANERMVIAAPAVLKFSGESSGKSTQRPALVN